MLIGIVEGLNIPIDGAPDQPITEGTEVNSIALLGHDYVGLSPTMRVKEGEVVKRGQTLFADRKNLV
jgi:Na+-transporting NADH:ubiquinone oxidoreductase subunit A